MKIDINRIPPEGLTLTEGIDASLLDLNIDMVKFRGSINVKANIYKITNTVTVDVALAVPMYANCSRCLSEFEIDLKKDLKLNYQVNKLEPIIDLNPVIREEIILDYPMKPLCSPDCKGLCPECGKNLNEGECKCVSL